MKVDVSVAFHWLEELNYNARWFGVEPWRAELQRNLAFPDSHVEAQENLRAVLEHADELTRAARALLAIVEDKDNG